MIQIPRNEENNSVKLIYHLKEYIELEEYINNSNSNFTSSARTGVLNL